VNTAVNYELVAKAHEVFQTGYHKDPSFLSATQWCERNFSEVFDIIKRYYIDVSRDLDGGQEKPFGNPPISSTVNGMSVAWKSIMSKSCRRDIMQSAGISEAELDSLTVDDVMCWGVTLITQRLLLVYATDAYFAGREPSPMEYMPYLAGNKFAHAEVQRIEQEKSVRLSSIFAETRKARSSVKSVKAQKTVTAADQTALHFQNFPDLKGDLSSVKKTVVGNPMYDPSGMLVAILLMEATEFQRQDTVQRLQKPEALLEGTAAVNVMQAACAGCGPDELVSQYFPDNAAASRLLVLTDGGGPADDEAALWLLLKQLESSDILADVVFMTGNPLQQAMRWASILNSLTESLRASYSTRIRYFLGPASDRPMKYPMIYNPKELQRAGLDKFDESVFSGGSYDVILQCSPLGDIADLEASSFGQIQCHLEAGFYITVGMPGSKEIPADDLHEGFARMLKAKGFSPIHLPKNSGYRPFWDKQLMDLMPPRLKDLVLEDEWNKLVDHTQRGHDLFQQFKRTTFVKYEMVSKVYSTMKQGSRDAEFTLADEWWGSIQDQAKEMIMEHHVNKLMQADAAAGEKRYLGQNATIMEMIRGKHFKWKSVMSGDLLQDLVEKLDLDYEKLANMSVQDVLCYSTLFMVGRLLKIYAVDCLSVDMIPSDSKVTLYLTGSSSNPPLHFNAFPSIRRLGQVKEVAVGSRMFDSMAMLAALAMLSANQADAKFFAKHLSSLGHDDDSPPGEPGTSGRKRKISVLSAANPEFGAISREDEFRMIYTLALCDAYAANAPAALIHSTMIDALRQVDEHVDKEELVHDRRRQISPDANGEDDVISEVV